MNVKLQKNVIRMGKIALYATIICRSLLLVMAHESTAQRKNLDEFNIELKFNSEKIALNKVFDQVSSNTDFEFAYNNANVKDKQLLLKSGNWNLRSLLNEISVQGHFSISRINEIITLIPVVNKELPDIYEEVRAQIRVAGQVLDENNEPLPGATIKVKGTNLGTISDFDGKFSLQVEKDAVLIVSFIGFVTQEVKIDSRSNYTIALSPDIESLEEVVVIGYGTKKRDDIITSISSVKTEDIMKVPSSDMGEMLRGKAAGVFVTVGDAGPGSSSNIQIRGKRSLSAGNDPIVIADGVPIGSINDVNPNDIKSIDILKDATAQAIYGARAANGVILITTKRGESGKTTINYNGFYGLQTVQRNFDVYSPQEFIQLKREAFRTENNGIYQSDRDIFTPTELRVMESGEFINWEEELIEVAPITNHNLSISSGSDKTTVYAGINYINQDGVVPGTDYQRGTIRINADQQLSEWMKVGINTSWQLSQNNTPGTQNTLLRSITSSPLGEIYNEDGSFKLNPSGVQESFNPLLDINTTSTVREDRNDIMNLFFDITPFKGFKYRFNGSRRSWNRKTTSYSSSESLVGIQRGGQGFGYLSYEDNVEWQFENILTYDFDFGSQHAVSITGVQSTISSEYNNFRNEASNLPNDILGINGLSSADINIPTVGGNERGLLSFAGRFEYEFGNRYYATASIRTDASTVFGANNKWSVFPAVAAGWNISNERFFSTNAINLLKVRASYGSVGNQGITPYQSQSLADQRDYIFGDTKVTGYSPGERLPNPDLKWETSTTLNLGLDFGLWTSKLTGTIELYDTRTTDLLVEQSINATTGYTEQLTNLGEVQNKGIELSLTGILVEKRDFTMSVGFNGAKNINKIISLYGKDEDLDGVEDDDLANNWFIGQPIDVLYRFESVGIFQQGEEIVNNTHQPDARPGDIKLFDRDPEDGELNASDRVITPLVPDWYGAFNFDIKYRQFDFTASVYTVQGIIKDNPYLYEYSRGGSLRAVFSGVKQDYWTPENPTGDFPRPNAGIDPDNLIVLGAQDASYIRLQNITIGYSLNKKLLDQLGISRLRFYATGQNLFTWTEYQSYSPEKTPDQYPEAIMVTGGIQFGF